MIPSDVKKNLTTVASLRYQLGLMALKLDKYLFQFPRDSKCHAGALICKEMENSLAISDITTM
jgi:hypothetical protein